MSILPGKSLRNCIFWFGGFTHRKRRARTVKKDNFYQKPSDASRVKQAIVATYFGAWKNVLKTWRNRPKLGYVDLYSGPGVYADGSHSTPLLILQQAIEDEYLADKLIAVFNDGDPQLAAELR